MYHQEEGGACELAGLAVYFAMIPPLRIRTLMEHIGALACVLGFSCLVFLGPCTASEATGDHWLAHVRRSHRGARGLNSRGICYESCNVRF